MGRVLLLTLTAAALLSAACAPAGPDAGPGSTLDDGHADLTCAACHRGQTASTGEPAVPRSACTGSGCHEDGGPSRLTVGSVTFEHRNHGGADSEVAMACAGCHTHTEGHGPILAGTDACALCHADELDGDAAGDCRVCHGSPDHLGFTSQGVAIPHEGLPWIQGECVRCHYDVAQPTQTVSAATCARCHEQIEAVTSAGIGQDLHPDHSGVGCTSCHASGGHRIVAMSSAVNLQCADCHLRVHDVDVIRWRPEAGACEACHRTVHQAQQRLVLGAVDHSIEATPSEKFLAGLTCRSCHVPAGAPALATRAPGAGVELDSMPVVGSAVSCTGCHRPEYRTVLTWWNEGTRQRERLTEAYVQAARASLGSSAPDTARALLREARSLLDLVEAAGGEHNLPLAHRLFGESVQRVSAAYRMTGHSVPPPPDLGTRPSMGLCSYCHYRLDDEWRFGEMDERFHREVLGVRRMERGQTP